MSESELRFKLEKYVKVTEELTNRMTILAQGGLNITDELRNIQEYSPTGIDEPGLIENRTLDLENEYNKLQRVYNEMNNAQQMVNQALQDTLKELNELINTRSVRSVRSSRRSTAKGISKKHKKRATKKRIRKIN
jgi:hypothetical protein